MARIISHQHAQEPNILCYHNDHLGTPNELTDAQGNVVWAADYEAWVGFNMLES